MSSTPYVVKSQCTEEVLCVVSEALCYRHSKVIIILQDLHFLCITSSAQRVCVITRSDHNGIEIHPYMAPCTSLHMEERPP